MSIVSGIELCRPYGSHRDLNICFNLGVNFRGEVKGFQMSIISYNDVNPWYLSSFYFIIDYDKIIIDKLILL